MAMTWCRWFVDILYVVVVDYGVECKEKRGGTIELISSCLSDLCCTYNVFQRYGPSHTSLARVHESVLVCLTFSGSVSGNQACIIIHDEKQIGRVDTAFHYIITAIITQ